MTCIAPAEDQIYFLSVETGDFQIQIRFSDIFCKIHGGNKHETSLFDMNDTRVELLNSKYRLECIF